MSADGTNPERVRSAIAHLNPNDREVWVRAGTCVKAEFGEAGFDLWDEWGSQAESHKASSAKSVWKSIKAAGALQIGSLFYDAKQAGWKDDTAYKKPSKEQIDARNAAAAQRREQAEAEEAVLREAAALRARAIWDAAAPATEHPYLTKKGVQAHGLRVGTWERIDADTGEFIVVSKNALLIPVSDQKKVIHSLQAIFPDGTKSYLVDGAKRGHMHFLGAKPLQRDGKNIFVLVEGYATGASIHECTGHLVIVCFDAGGLGSVAAQIRARQPEAVIIFAADNDSDTDGNPGVRAAIKAALEVDGLVAVPPPGDFNDLHQQDGPDAVVDALDAADKPVPATDPLPPQEQAPTAPVAALTAADVMPVDEHAHSVDFDPLGYFSVLGYDRGTYYFYSNEQKQIIDVRSGEVGSDAFMLSIAPLAFWEMHLPKSDGKPGLNRIAFMDWVFRLAAKRGIYDASRIRGRGAWLDAGRFVFHHGLNMTVDGETVGVETIKSKYVYELARSLPVPDVTAMADAEGLMLLETAEMFRWTRPGAAPLLAGWTFLAPVCGALKWRPHIWLTGGAGSGKSTILNEYVNGLLSGVSVFAQGNSTEAGIRQRLKADALPVLFDESEQNNEAEKKRMEGVLSLIRQASTESPAQTLKGTISGDSMNFHIRSMFCLASIQVGMEHKADQDRLTKLSLMKAQDDAGAAEKWAKIKDALYEIRRDTTLPNRMLRRLIDNLPTLHSNIAVFVQVAAKYFGTQRMGDQYGTLLAGAWVMHRLDVATPELALKMIEKYEWSEFTEGGEVDDSEKALRAILESKIMHKGEAISVGSIITIANDGYIDGLVLDAAVARRLMRDNGMNFSKGHLVFQNGSKSLQKMVADTPFAADLSSQLLRVPQAKKFHGCRFGATMARAVGVPLSMVTTQDENEPPI